MVYQILHLLMPTFIVSAIYLLAPNVSILLHMGRAPGLWHEAKVPFHTFRQRISYYLYWPCNVPSWSKVVSCCY